MKVLTFLPPSPLRKRVSTALSVRQCVEVTAVSAEECLQFAQQTEYEAILLQTNTESYADVLILIKLLRDRQPNVSLFVFERNLDLDQRLRLFDAGVDDCVREPFFSAEFVMRLGVSVRLRQAASNQSASKAGGNVLSSGDLELNLVRRTVTRLGNPIDLRPKEFLLLEYLVRNENRPVTRTMILEHVWHSSFEGLTNVVDVYINALRNKLDRDFPEKLIQTNRGVGYTFTRVPAGRTGVRQERGGAGMRAEDRIVASR
jgi:two-component system, OmpR family, response regulator